MFKNMSLLLTAMLVSKALVCPTVPTQSDFNVTEYVRSSWYIHAQQPTSYLTVDDNYCVVATYSIPDLSKTRISVYNYARKSSVNGKNVNAKHRVLCAKPSSCFYPSKLKVNLCWLPDFFAGDYWVIAAGPSRSNYEWAIVSGGQPTPSLVKGRTDKRICVGKGLWPFSRSKERNQTQIDLQLSIVNEVGISPLLLNPVIQTGCLYSDMYIKP